MQNRRTRILVVDDSELARTQICEALAGEGYDTQTASDGATALSIAEENPLDIVLVDKGMPGMDGFELLRRLKEDRCTASASVVMVTGDADPETLVRALDKGAADFIQNPCSPSVVRARVRHLAHQREMTRELEDAWRKANEATKSKSEFLANMSHEIRTPMTAILGYADVLLENMRVPSDIHAANTIKRNGEYLIRIINDILDLAKIEAGKLDVDQAVCSPGQILADVVSLMRVRSCEKQLSLDIEYEEPIPRTARVDPFRLKQILLNLTGNAIKFTDSGSVKLVARFDAFTENPVFRVSVVDTGCGIDSRRINDLFRPFSQADNSSARRFGGTGLGLAICQRLAELMGGKIEVESEIGVGSRFTLVLPVEVSESGGLIHAPNEVPGLGGGAPPVSPLDAIHGRILLAEDGLDNQRLIAFLLRKAGADVTVVENGQLALEHALAATLNNAEFDAILMDMQMPVMDGYIATRKLRENGYAGPIIALTAHAMSSDRQKCLDAGCDDYATKPIDRQQLVRLVASYTNSRSERHECEKPAHKAMWLTGLVERAGSVARSYAEDHRATLRAFLQLSVDVTPVVDGKPDHGSAFSAVTGDLSSIGLGLLATVEPALGPVQMTVHDKEREIVIDGEIRWTQRVGSDFCRMGVETHEPRDAYNPDFAQKQSIEAQGLDCVTGTTTATSLI